MVPRLLSPPRRKIFLLRGVDFPDIFSAGPTFLKKLSSRGGDFSDCQQDSPPRRKVFCFRGAVLPGTCLFLPLGFLKTSFSGGCLARHLLFLPPGFLKTSFSGGSLAWHLLFLPLGFLIVSFSGGCMTRHLPQSQCKGLNCSFCTVDARCRVSAKARIMASALSARGAAARSASLEYQKHLIGLVPMRCF